MKRILFLSLFMVASVASAQVVNCPSGFSVSSSSTCGMTSSFGTSYFAATNAAVSGTQAIIVPAGCNHCAESLNYQKTPVNVQAFHASWTFVPNEYNGVFVLQNNTNNAAVAFGLCTTGTCGFVAGAGFEGGFFQAFSGNGLSTTNLFALEFSDNHSFANCTNPTCAGSSYTGSSAQIYQAQQNPYSPNYGTEQWYWTTDKILTAPVQMSSPPTTQQTSTGHTYSAAVTYDGSTFTYSLFDVTAGGSCPGSTCFTKSWNNVNIPSMVHGNTAYLGITGGSNAATASPFYLNSLVYTVDTPPANQSISTYTASSASGSPFVVAPTFTPVAGSYSGAQSVTIASTTPSAYYCYTLSASFPSFLPQTDNMGGCTEGTRYSGPVSVSSSQTLYAMGGLNVPTLGLNGRLPSSLVVGAYVIGGSTPTVATPVITPATGTYSSNQTVAVSNSTPGAIDCVTTDGTTPAASTPGSCSHGTPYSGTFVVSATTTVQALGTLATYLNSAVASVTLTISYPTAATPTFSPPAGSYGSEQSVSILDATAGASMYYTTDGTIPTYPITGSTSLYSAPIPVSISQTIQALAVAAGYQNSAIGTAAYTLGVAVPVMTPSGGSYSSAQVVNITDATPCASIYYTVDGTTPTYPVTGTTTLYSGPLYIPATTTVKAIGVLAGNTTSAVNTQVYTLTIGALRLPSKGMHYLTEQETCNNWLDGVIPQPARAPDA